MYKLTTMNTMIHNVHNKFNFVAKIRLEPDEWAILKSNVPILQGLKVFDQNAREEWYSRLRKNAQGLSVFIPGHRLATNIKSGAHGAYSNMACLNPYAAHKWYDLIQSDMGSRSGAGIEDR